MGLILDTSILIASERRRESVEQLLERIESVHSAIETTLSVISVVELTTASSERKGIRIVTGDENTQQRSTEI